jgi:hypothetical protein
MIDPAAESGEAAVRNLKPISRNSFLRRVKTRAAIDQAQNKLCVVVLAAANYSSTEIYIATGI